MKEQNKKKSDTEVLRQRAEKILENQQPKVGSFSSEDDIRKTYFELQVHQIELEMQNEELMLAKIEADAAAKKADAAAKKYTELYDFAPSGYFTLNKEGEITELNIHGASLLGKEQQKLINAKFGFIVSEDTKPIFNLFLDKVFEGKGKESCEVTLSVESKNSPTYVYITGHVVETAEQSLISVVDITERKLQEELSQKNKSLNKLNQFAFEATNLPLNDNLEAFIAKQVKEISGAEIAIFSEYNSANRTITPKYIEAESGLLNKGLSLLATKMNNTHTIVSDKMYQEWSTKLITVWQTIHDASFGTIPRSVAEAIQALLNADRFIALSFFIEGQFYGSSLLAMKKEQPDPPKEILENFILLASVSLRRKKAKKALKESEEKYRRLTENAKDMIYRMSLPNGEYEYVSPASIDIWEYSPEEFYNSPLLISKTIHPDYYDYFKTEWEKVICGELSPVYEYKIITKSGKEKWLHQRNVLIKDTQSNPIAMQGIVTDITERKLAELAIEEHERKLIQLNADKDRFISILGHDLKNPFNILLGFTELLTNNIHKFDTDEIEKIVKIINNSAQSNYDLLNDLLAWTRSQRGNIPFEPQNLSLTDVCDDVLITLAPIANKKDIEIKCLIDDSQNVFADNDMLKTVLRNLVANAIKFTNKGGSIIINTEEKSESVIISVSDNGIGIRPENLAKLFDISEILTTTGTSEESGTGLGLLLCKEFVEKHGGRIWVESEEGKGSEFRFTLQAALPTCQCLET